jgi:uncharacterized protein YoxC
MPSVGLSNSPSIAEISLAVIAVAFVVAVAVLIPVLLQIRRTARQAEGILRNVNGTLPDMLAEARAILTSLGDTSGTLRDVAASVERLDKLVDTAARTVENVRDSARQMAEDVIMPSVATAAGVFAALREGIQWIRPRPEKGRDD